MRKKVIDNPMNGLSFLYNNKFGRIILKFLVEKPFVSKLSGFILDRKISKIMIKPFIKANNINMDDFINTKYNSFNDFFVRKIKKEKRPICKDNNSFIAPCDGKLTCYKINSKTIFNIKNTLYDTSSLIKDDDLARKYSNGYALVFRLSPDDYHRYAFIDDGKIIKNYKINGKFHTVNPIVYDKFEVFKENTRQCTIIDTKNFGQIVQIEVGALLVGKIKNVVTSGIVKKAQEKGYFMYGGSTIVVLVKKGIIKIDEEILTNSLDGFETYVKYGEKIADKIKKYN